MNQMNGSNTLSTVRDQLAKIPRIPPVTTANARPQTNSYRLTATLTRASPLWSWRQNSAPIRVGLETKNAFT